MARIQVKDGDGPEQDGSGWDNEKWIYFADRSIRFANVLDMESEKERT